MSAVGPPPVPPPDRVDLEFHPGQPLPVFARREGVEVVVIRSDEYRELLGLRARAARQTVGAAVRAIRAPPPGLSTIERDPEVANFLCGLFRGRMTLQALRAACVERFGEGRAPSTGRISTFRVRWRSY